MSSDRDGPIFESTFYKVHDKMDASGQEGGRRSHAAAHALLNSMTSLSASVQKLGTFFFLLFHSFKSLNKNEANEKLIHSTVDAFYRNKCHVKISRHGLEARPNGAAPR